MCLLMLVRLALIISLLLQPSSLLPVRNVFGPGGLAASACSVGHAVSDVLGCCAGLVLPDGSSPCGVLDACPCVDDPEWPEPACPARAGTSENTRAATLDVPRPATMAVTYPAARRTAAQSASPPYRALGHNRARALVCCWTT